VASSPSSWPPHLPPSPLPLPRCGRGRGRGWSPSPSPLASLRSHTGRRRGEGGLLTFVLAPSPSPLPPSSPTLRARKGGRLVPLTFPPGPFTLSHGARKGGGWPPHLRPGPLTFPPAPFLSHAAGEEGGEVGPPHLPPWPLYALTRGDEEGRVASLPSSWPPHLPPSPLPLPRCGRGRGRGWSPSPSPSPLYALTRGDEGGRVASLPSSWPPLTFPQPLYAPTLRARKGERLVPLTDALNGLLSPGSSTLYAAGEEGGRLVLFTLSHGATKGGGWPPYLRPGPLTFPPAPFLSYAASFCPFTLSHGARRGEWPPHLCPGPPLTYALTLRERKGGGWSPHLPPCPFTLSHGARKGGGWPPYLRPGPLTFPPAPFLSLRCGRGRGRGWSPSRNGRTG
jgi:hypothetical protein